MANLSQLQMPSIDTGQLSGKDGKKIKSYLFQIQEMLRYALNDIDEDNLSEELRSKIESGGLSSEISQALDAITLRVTGLDDAQAELKLTAEGLTSQVEAQGGRISTLEQTATSITARVETAEGDITTLEQTATSLTGRIESAEGDINTLTATATGLEGRIESAEGSITTLTATADGLSTRVESAEGNITSLTQTAEGFGTRIETAEGDTTIFCADTRYQKYGWWHDSSFQGITIEQVDNSVGCSGKLEVNQGIQCRSLSAWDAKNRIVRTDFGNLAINAVESPEPMFCDAGSGECDETGLCYIATEPRYRETVSETQDLRWALTPTGASAALWAEKTAFGAIVHGPAGQCFDWVCWGVQRGFEGVYADVSDAKYPEEENRGAALLDAAETEAAVSLPLTIEEAS